MANVELAKTKFEDYLKRIIEPEFGLDPNELDKKVDTKAETLNLIIGILVENTEGNKDFMSQLMLHLLELSKEAVLLNFVSNMLKEKSEGESNE